MTSKIKNIIIFTVIAALLILVYIFFIKKAPVEQNLISSSGTSSPANTNVIDQNSSIANSFLSVLLSVKSIKLDDSIFSDSAFINLHDSSILLTPPGDEGRPNPFAPIGYEDTQTPAITTPPVIPVSPTTPTPTTTPPITTPPVTTPPVTPTP